MKKVMTRLTKKDADSGLFKYIVAVSLPHSKVTFFGSNNKRTAQAFWRMNLRMGLEAVFGSRV